MLDLLVDQLLKKRQKTQAFILNRTQLFLGLALKKEINGGVKAGKRRRSDPGGGLLRKDGIYDIPQNEIVER